MPYVPLSKDIETEHRLSIQRGFYRLAFGQPRQEDLLSVLGAADGQQDHDALRIDLAPPAR